MNGELERSWLFYKERTPHSLSEAFKCDFVGIQTQNLLIRSQMLYSVELRSLQKSDFVGIQTQNLLIRSQMLYSVELRSLFAFASAKIRTSFETSKASGKKSYSDHTQIIF